MLDKISAFAQKYNMFPYGSTVICGLSGGADSVCLTLCMSLISEKLGITVEAVHVNHCIRGEESDRDEQFCRDLCQKLGIWLYVFRCDVPAYAREHSISLEDAARRLRYDAFRNCSEGKIIATAHNANDNLETAVFNLTRGSGLKGITGIPPVRDNIVRPLLTVTRAEIEAFLQENAQSFVTDSTNLSEDYTRNKIRHRVIPLLRQINPSLDKTAVSTLEILREENDFIENEVRAALSRCRKGNSLTDTASLPSLILRRCIAALLSENNIPYSHDRLEECEKIALSGGKLNVKNNLYLISDKTSLTLAELPHATCGEQLSCPLEIGMNSIFENTIVIAECISYENISISQFINKSSTNYFIDYDKIKGKPILRNRRFGDKIRLNGRNFTSSVKKLINENIPPEMRDKLHFIDDDDGTVFAEKIGIAERVYPDENTKNLLKITVKHIN